MTDLLHSLKAKGYERGTDGIFRRPDSDGPPVSQAALLARAPKKKPAAGKKISPLTTKFEALWQELGGPHLTAEYRFCKTRKWRADYAHERAMILIELDGGVYSNGRHTRGSGFIKDCEKLNVAAQGGFRVFRLATGMIRAETVTPIIETIRKVISDQ